MDDIRKDFNDIGDIIERSKTMEQGDIKYVLDRIVNKVDSIRNLAMYLDIQNKEEGKKTIGFSGD
jgi:hypothetical protein